jgi:hypothetical protein
MRTQRSLLMSGEQIHGASALSVRRHMSGVDY